jgi:hypothetical protein
MSWKGTCRVCGKLRQNGAGVFCSNFSTSKGGFPQCRNVWCGTCYRTKPEDPFPVKDPLEEDQLLETGDDRDQDYRTARNGDHLMGVPFECDLCHFRNVVGRDPVWGKAQDEYTLTCIRRASLDAMWGRASSTVKANLSRVQKDYRASQEVFAIRKPLPELGWDKLEDRVGMGVALMTLHSSLRRGKYAETLQFDTMRKTPTWYGHMHRGGRAYNTETLYAQDERRVRSSTCPTDGEWFTRFKLGAKLRMGQIRKQNEALTPDIIHALDHVAEEEWNLAEPESDQRMIEDLMSFVLIEFCAGLRGEEVPLISLEGMLRFWHTTTALRERPHVVLTLHGRFKGEAGERWHCVPIAVKTRTGLPVFKWLERLMRRRTVVEKRESGWLFGDAQGKRRRFGFYDPLFLEMLTRARSSRPECMDQVVELEDFSLWRSGRRGATTEAGNQKVSAHVIDLMGRWRQKEAAKGSQPGLPMRQVYTQVKSSFPAMLLYSEVF